MNDPDNSRYTDEVTRAQQLASRFGCEFVDLHNFGRDQEILKRFAPGLMLRYNFVPLEETADGRLAIAIADPSQLIMIDEISLLVRKRIITKVATMAQIRQIQRGMDPTQEIASDPTDEPPGPDPAAPVYAPKKPRPRPHLGGAEATPELEQSSAIPEVFRAVGATSISLIFRPVSNGSRLD